MSQTYNQVIQRNKLFSEAHYKLKGFGNGLYSDVLDKNQVATYKYPLMFMEDLPAPMSPGVETFAFRVHFFSPVASHEGLGLNVTEINPNEIKSDMRQCAKDLLAFWVKDHDFPDFSIIKNTDWNFMVYV